MLSPTRFHQIFRASAIYDLSLSVPFAIAPGVALVWWAMDAIGQSLGLAPLTPLDPHGVMFANFFGTIVTLWSILRLRLDLPALARWDAAGRMFFSLAMAVALANGASPLLWPLLGLEMLWAIAQLLPVTDRPWSDPSSPKRAFAPAS